MNEENTQHTETENHEQSLVKAPTLAQLVEPDFVRMEKNIAAFGFFTPSSKRLRNSSKTIRFTQVVEGQRVEARVKVSSHKAHGMPITADQDKYLAFQKIIERVRQEQGLVENPITFTTAELLALLESSSNGNRYREVEEWLKVMSTTFIESAGAIWIAGKKKFATDSFVLFQRVRRIGQELDDGAIADRNYVWLSDWYLENLHGHYLLPIDFETYKLLKTNIAKALIPLLQIWLYASREAGVFEKRYDELCDVLGIAKYRYLSKIKETLAPALDELLKFGYLAAWSIEKTTGKKGYKLIFRHGGKFYQDRVKQLTKVKPPKLTPTAPPQKPEASNPEPTREQRPQTAPPAPSNKPAASPRPNKIALALESLTDEARELVRQLHVEYQIGLQKALDLAANYLEEAHRQLAAYPFRDIKPSNQAGFLINAIEKAYSLPEAYLTHLQDKAFEAERTAQQKPIDDCPMCDNYGCRNIKSERAKDFGLTRECTHDFALESQFEEHEIELPPEYMQWLNGSQNSDWP